MMFDYAGDLKTFKGVGMREILSYSFAIPPTIFIVVCLAGALIGLARPLIGTKIVLASSIALYIFATPAASTFLVHQLVALIPANVDLTNAQAIVVPGADIRAGDHGHGSETVGPLTLERLVSAAQLYRRLHLPIAVSGGPLSSDSPISLASVMRDELERQFSVPVTFTENESHNTFENALFTDHLLKSAHIDRVVVVVQARDMSRVLWSFSRASLHALPYCTDSCAAHATHLTNVGDFLPSARAFCESYYAFHEIIGLIYYKAFY
jgi:uncharacterized SAM-binding protein YcdF (DUF218 family)